MLYIYIYIYILRAGGMSRSSWMRWARRVENEAARSKQQSWKRKEIVGSLGAPYSFRGPLIKCLYVLI